MPWYKQKITNYVYLSNVLDLFDDETVVKIINEYNSVGEDHDLIVYEGSLSEIPSKITAEYNDSYIEYMSIENDQLIVRIS